LFKVAFLRVTKGSEGRQK